MEKDITHNQDPKKDIQVYEAALNFIKDKEGIQLYKRALKISKAYFLLTQHIQDNDSIKLSLRAASLDMSSKTLSLVAAFNKTEDLARAVAVVAMTLASVSDIAAASRLIGDSNHALVIRQVQIFIEEVEVYWKTLSDTNQAIPSNLFEVETLDASYKNSRIIDDISNAHTLNTSNTLFVKDSTRDPVHSSVRPHTSPSHHKVDVYKTSNQHTKQLKAKPVSVDHRAASQILGVVQAREIKNDRQSLILSTIRSRGESSIKDLTDVIKGCSEKTIQRELIALVGSGDLLKTGERRWSRYTIAQ